MSAPFHVVEFTRLLPTLTARGWMAGMRVIARGERPHPGARLRLTDTDGWRNSIRATNTPDDGPGTQLADPELRHRARARGGDRIRVPETAGCGTRRTGRHTLLRLPADSPWADGTAAVRTRLPALPEPA